MALDDVEVVVRVEGDVQRLIEHPVPRGVAPSGVLTALAEHHQDVTFRAELPEHIPVGVGCPDVAASVHAQRMRIDGDVWVEHAQHFAAGGVVFDHLDLGVAIEYEQMSVRRERDGGDVPP